MKQIGRTTSKSVLMGFISVAVLIVLSACQNGQTAITPSSDAVVTATPIWHATLTISGGIKGISQSLSVDQQGVAQFTDHLNKTYKSREISAESLKNLTEMIKNYSSTNTTKVTKPTNCRDCFNYTIITKYDGEEYTVFPSP